MTIEKASDLPAWLNNLYFMTYIMRHEIDVGDVEKAFVERMDQIAGSAVLYDAAANYDGDRSALCTLFEEEKMDVTVPWRNAWTQQGIYRATIWDCCQTRF